jgi:hypothetical protein
MVVSVVAMSFSLPLVCRTTSMPRSSLSSPERKRFYPLPSYAFLPRMSYLFVAYLWEKNNFAPQCLVDTWAEADPRFAGEELFHVTVNPRIEAAFYFTGNLATKSEAFSYGCEAMLMDGWAESPAEDRREAGDLEFRYMVWLSSDMFDYDVVLCYDGDSFEGRAIIDGQAERVKVVDGVVTDYELASTAVDPADFGADGKQDKNFDEAAYHKAVAAREKPFSPGDLVHKTLRINRQDVILALHKAWDDKGKALWPEGGAQDTPELRKELESADSFMPSLPLWTEYGEQVVEVKKPEPPKEPKKEPKKESKNEPKKETKKESSKSGAAKKKKKD